MKTRIITSVVGIAVLLAVMMFFSTVLFDLAIAVLALIALHEAWGAVGYTKKDWHVFAGLVPVTVMVMLSGCPAVTPWILPVLSITAMGYALLLVTHSEEFSFSKLSSFILFSTFIVFSFYSFIYLKYALPVTVYKAEAVYFIALSLCFAWGGDTFAYFAGCFFGKHKLAPIVSPKKTIEGAVGGVLGCILLGEIATVVYQNVDDTGCTFFAHRMGATFYVIIALVGVIAALLGILGDLFASVIKRQHGIKDYGTIFPGHGGILDRFDSVMFVVLFVSMVVRLLFHFGG